MRSELVESRLVIEEGGVEGEPTEHLYRLQVDCFGSEDIIEHVPALADDHFISSHRDFPYYPF